MSCEFELMGLCDFCSKPFYENDFRLKQISNECANVFKLEFCDIDCLQAVEKDFTFVRLFEFQKTNEYNYFNKDEDNIMGEFMMKHRNFAFVNEKHEENQTKNLTQTHIYDNQLFNTHLAHTPVYDNPIDINKNKIDLDNDYICLDFEDNKNSKSVSKSGTRPKIRKTYDVINQYLTLRNSNIETLTNEQKKFLEFCEKHKLIK